MCNLLGTSALQPPDPLSDHSLHSSHTRVSPNTIPRRSHHIPDLQCPSAQHACPLILGHVRCGAALVIRDFLVTYSRHRILLLSSTATSLTRIFHVDDVVLGVIAIGHFGVGSVGLVPIGGGFRAIGVFDIVGIMRFEWLIFFNLGLIRLISTKCVST